MRRLSNLLLVLALLGAASLSCGDLGSDWTMIKSAADVRAFAGKLITGRGPLWDKLGVEPVVVRRELDVTSVEIALVSILVGVDGSARVLPVVSTGVISSEVWVGDVGSAGNYLREINLSEKLALSKALEQEVVQFAGNKVFSDRLQFYLGFKK